MKKILFALTVMLACGFTTYAQWVAEPSGASANNFVQFIDAVDANVVWGVVADPTQLNAVQEFVRTTDGGQTWTDAPITNAPGLGPSSIFALNADTAWVAMYSFAGGAGEILRTDDGGATWNVQPTALFNATGNFPDFVHFWDANNGICLGDPTAGYYEIYTTTDGGVTWIRVPSAGIPAPEPAEFGLTDLYASNGDSTIWFGTTTGRIFKTTDRGQNWTVAPTPYAGNYIGQIAFRDANNGLASNGTLGALPDLIRTTDGGATWTLVATNTANIAVKQGLCYVTGTDSTYFLSSPFVGAGGSAYSPDDGNNWVLADNLTHSDIEFVNDSTGWSGSNEPNAPMYKWSTPVLVAPNDVSSSSIDVPLNNVLAIQDPLATFKNNGLTTQTFDVTITITGGYTSTKTISALAFNGTQQVTFDPWTPAASGVYTVTIYTQLAADADLSNDTLTKDVNVYGKFENYGWVSKPDLALPAFDNALVFDLNGISSNSPGTLYNFGGIAADLSSLQNNADSFATALNTWAPFIAMPGALYAFSAQRIGSKIYIGGGFLGIAAPSATMYIYDITSGSWSNGASMPTPVGDYACGTYNDSLIYYINGYSAVGETNMVQIYNTITDSWSTGTASPGNPTQGSRGSILGNQIIFTSGFSGLVGAPLVDAWEGTINAANPAQITWISLPPYPGGPVFRSGAGIPYKGLKPLVIFTGGDPTATGTTITASCWGYDLSSNEWKVGPDKITAVNNLCDLAGVVYNDSLWIASAGGYDAVSVQTVHEWLNLGASPPLGINEHNVMSNDLLSIYPNPAGNEITVKLKNNTDAVSFTITDVSGRIVQTETINKGQAIVRLKIKTLESGVYLLQVTGADNNAKGYTKFIKE